MFSNPPMTEPWEAELAAELEDMSAATARLNRLARKDRANIMSSSPGWEWCTYCGHPSYEPGWGCHACGTGEL